MKKPVCEEHDKLMDRLKKQSEGGRKGAKSRKRKSTRAKN